ncbi:hypothetical protein MG290_14750 (plasmid) [Flavobacterium sp. CBA20B-1]|uniref:hypothetical protein n=1 Tax=unclassified Flavobacterium TaxID=196869 RepID=UPI0022240444|nr:MULTISPECIES: hypothetical protein [unclassified Flavobacterium]WCM43602.1 hypothetical protein MG290_14750 [Flavobacterium sp. CBA20B-1]
MAKDFKRGMEYLFGESSVPKKEQKQVVNHESDKTSIEVYFKNKEKEEKEEGKKNGLKEGETRFIFIANRIETEKIKAIAHYNRLPIKDFMGNIISKYLEAYIEEVGEDEFKIIEETYLKTLK